MTVQLTPKQRAFLQWADRTTGHPANKSRESVTAVSLSRRGFIELRMKHSLPHRWFLTDAGKAALKEIGE